MSDMYPYCSKCDSELTIEEKKMNEIHENMFYPICNSCLDIHVKALSEIAKKIEEK